MQQRVKTQSAFADARLRVIMMTALLILLTAAMHVASPALAVTKSKAKRNKSTSQYVKITYYRNLTGSDGGRVTQTIKTTDANKKLLTLSQLKGKSSLNWTPERKKLLGFSTTRVTASTTAAKASQIAGSIEYLLGKTVSTSWITKNAKKISSFMACGRQPHSKSLIKAMYQRLNRTP